MSEVHGPIDFVLLEFTGDRLTGKTADALLDLVESGIIRLYDLVVIRKDEDGSFSGVVLDASMADAVGGFMAFSGAQSGLLGDDDLKEAGQAMTPGSIAALIVYENAWAIPFIGAALDAGGALIASARIPATDVIAALDALDASA